MRTRYIISVCNIPWTISHSELEKYFLKYGDIKYAKIVFDKYGFSTGCGFVEFCQESVMHRVLHDSHSLENENLFVSNNMFSGNKVIKDFIKKNNLINTMQE